MAGGAEEDLSRQGPALLACSSPTPSGKHGSALVPAALRLPQLELGFLATWSVENTANMKGIR